MSTAAPTRKQAREAARQERRRREEEARLRAARKRRLAWLGGTLGTAIVVVAAVIAVASGGGGSAGSGAASGGGAKGAASVAAEFRGIPQSGNTLGSPTAPATLVVFADLQCPFCADFENQVMPTLVQRYVRPGKLRIVFRPISIVGNDSVTGARMVSAAALQNRGFQFASLWYRNQGTENTGYATKAYVERLAKATPGLNVAKALDDMAGERVGTAIARAASAANRAQIKSTPSFLVGRRGEALQQVRVQSLTPSAFDGILDPLVS